MTAAVPRSGPVGSSVVEAGRRTAGSAAVESTAVAGSTSVVESRSVRASAGWGAVDVEE